MHKRLILFHRRLLVLIAVFVTVLVVLVTQVARLTIAQGEERLQKRRGGFIQRRIYQLGVVKLLTEKVAYLQKMLRRTMSLSIGI